MIRLARGGKCGADKMPLKGFPDGERVAAAASRFNKLKSAAPPRPKANRPKKSRRFIAKLIWVQFTKQATKLYDSIKPLIFTNLRESFLIGQDEALPLERVFMAEIDQVA